MGSDPVTRGRADSLHSPDAARAGITPPAGALRPARRAFFQRRHRRVSGRPPASCQRAVHSRGTAIGESIFITT